MSEVAGIPTEIWEMIGAYSELPERLALTSTNQRMAGLREQPELWPEIPTTAPDVPTHNSIQQAYWIHGQDLGHVREVGQLGSQWCDLRPVSAQGHRYLVYRKQFEHTLCLWNLDTNQTLSQQLNFSPTMLRVLSVAPMRIGIEGAATSASGARHCHIFDARLNSLGAIPIEHAAEPLWPCPVHGEGHLYQNSAGTPHPIEWRLEDGAYQAHQLTQTAHPGTCSSDTIRLGNQSYYISQQGELMEHGVQAPYTPTWTLPPTVHYGGPQQISGVRFGEGWLVLFRSPPYGEEAHTYDTYRVWLKDDGTCQLLSTHTTQWVPLGLAERDHQPVETYIEHRGINDYRIQEVTPFPPAEESVNSSRERMLVWGKWATFASALISLRLTWRHCPPLQRFLTIGLIVCEGVMAGSTQDKLAMMAFTFGGWCVCLSGGKQLSHNVISTLCISTWAASYCFAIDYYNRPRPPQLSDVFSPTPQEPDTP